MASLNRVLWLLSHTILLEFLACANLAAPSQKKNVLFIVVDDLRPQLGCYGQKYMHTPNIDQLAEKSLLFERAYCQFSFCAPSRNSFMTGRRPDRTKAWSFRDHFREPGIGQNWTSLPQYFKKHGYFTVGVGKLYHPGLPPKYDPPSWTDEDIFPYVNPQPKPCPQDASRCGLDTASNNFSDILTLQAGLERLRYAAKQKGERAFFLGVGFHKPHLPFRIPTEYMDMYKLAIKAPTNGHFPKGSPPVAWNDCWRVWPHPFSDTNVTVYSINTSMNVDDVLALRRGYYGAVSFTDSLIGQLLQELETLGLANDTIVSLHADHGWQLGEHNEWCKMSNFELGVRVPLLLRVPWYPQAMGQRTMALAELVDLYPTLAELAGLPKPLENIQGVSLASLLDKPAASVKAAAFSQFPKCGSNMDWLSPCGGNNRTTFTYMGYSIRTDRYRYTEWVKWIGEELKPDWNQVVGRELYDHLGDAGDDFNGYENVNIVNDQSEVADGLRAALRQQFNSDG